MKIEFTATEIGCIEELGVISCGASNAADEGAEYHYVNFQRSADIGDPNDSGVYFEVDDQGNSGYNVIRGCRLERNGMTIETERQAGTFSGLVVVVHFERPGSAGLSPLDEGLKRIFRSFESRLVIEP